MSPYVKTLQRHVDTQTREPVNAVIEVHFDRALTEREMVVFHIFLRAAWNADPHAVSEFLTVH